MSEPDLPADVGRWPRDPFRLLRVPRDASPRDLKKAYLDLIRRYKPEHAPEEFRRIREAYEAASAQRPLHAFPVRVTWDELEELSARNEPPGERTDPTDAPPRTRSSQAVLEPWTRACEGDEEGAYRQLAALAERTPIKTATTLQLFWLLTLRPELDSTKSPLDWLVRRALGSQEVAELLCREFARDREQAVAERFDVLRKPSASPDLVLRVIEERWRAARMLRRWHLILADVEGLRSWMGTSDESAWCRTLIAAARQLVWSEGRERARAQALSREVDRHYHLAPELADPLTELDFAQALAVGWSTLLQEYNPILHLRHKMEMLIRVGADVTMARNLRQLLPRSWDAPYWEYRALHRDHLRRVIRRPLWALTFLDRVYGRSKPVIGHLSSLLDRRRAAEPAARAPLDASEISDAVLDFLAASPSWRFPIFRPAVLGFCQRQATSPAAFARVVDTHVRIARNAGQTLARAIEADRVLHYVSACCHTTID